MPAFAGFGTFCRPASPFCLELTSQLPALSDKMHPDAEAQPPFDQPPRSATAIRASLFVAGVPWHRHGQHEGERDQGTGARRICLAAGWTSVAATPPRARHRRENPTASAGRPRSCYLGISNPGYLRLVAERDPRSGESVSAIALTLLDDR